MTSPVQQWPYGDQGASAVTVTVPVSYASGNKQLVTGIGVLTSVTMSAYYATSKALAMILDGTDTSGPPIAIASAPAGGQGSPSLGYPGVLFRRGLYLWTIAGPVVMVVTYVPLLTQP